jgi:AraC family ethanolamine operon transcriptional activator
MQLSSLTASSILTTYRYRDLDEFRQAYRSVDVHFTPTCRTASPEQAILSLPGCDIYLLKTFSRVLDATLSEGHTYIGLTMEDVFPLRFNGMEKDRPALSIGHGGSSYKMVEDGESFVASVIFHPEVRRRGWPAGDRLFNCCEITAVAEQRIRTLIIQAFMLASATDAHLFTANAAVGIRETLMAAIDVAFADQRAHELSRLGTSKRYFDIVQRIEKTISDRFDAPIYSETLASEIGVSVRTLHNAMQQLRGMSLHRYLRMKRLWSVRRQLLSGAQKVSACAFANGFWHLGEFSQFYSSQFGETPSQTMARAR